MSSSFCYKRANTNNKANGQITDFPTKISNYIASIIFKLLLNTTATTVNSSNNKNHRR